MNQMEDKVTLAHGGGGQKTAALIRDIFTKHFQNPDLTSDDAAVLELQAPHVALTTDGFIVSPWQFPGGNIGKLAVCGTVNDLACMGARPRYLTCAFQIEEGFPLASLNEIAVSMAKTAKKAGARLVAGDTKVAGRGQVDGLFITATGLGERLPAVKTSGKRARPGDKILVTGDIGRHGCAILLARGSYGIEAEITSDCTPLFSLVEALFAVQFDKADIHTIRDATRGGVGTVLYEIATESDVGILLDESSIPVHPAVRGLTGLLGLNPLYLACEGRLVIFCAPDALDCTLAALRAQPDGKDAALIGTVTEENKGRVVLETEIGTKALLPAPTGELLPRIC